MPKTFHYLPLIALGALAAPAALAAGDTVTPGMWATTVTVTDIAGGDFPPEVAAMMRGKPHTYNHCVTPEEAAKGPREMLAQSSSCTFSKFDMAGGHLDAVMRCPQNNMTVTESGTYGPASYAATSHMVMQGQGGMTMTANVTGRRTGACK